MTQVDLEILFKTLAAMSTGSSLSTKLFLIASFCFPITLVFTSKSHQILIQIKMCFIANCVDRDIFILIINDWRIYFCGLWLTPHWTMFTLISSMSQKQNTSIEFGADFEILEF